MIILLASREGIKRLKNFGRNWTYFLFSFEHLKLGPLAPITCKIVFSLYLLGIKCST